MGRARPRLDRGKDFSLPKHNIIISTTD